jgi:hypothetical protein
VSTVCVVVSDRPPHLYLDECLRNLETFLPLHVDVHVVDDTEHRLGMAGAVQAGFDWALSTDAEFVLWVEEDFRFVDLPLTGMAWVLTHCRHLAQVVLKRQPWSVEEQQAGGQIETNPAAYSECSAFGANIHWVEHSTLFSLNPCLLPRRTLELGWPSGPLGVGNESGMTQRCQNAGLRFAYYGKRDDPPRCEHVGHHRSSGWRL